MYDLVLQNCKIVNENKIIESDIAIKNNRIELISNSIDSETKKTVDLNGKYVLPGLIDDQVHFREPGLTHKGDIATESRAGLAGGVTSYFEMPNVNPTTTTNENLSKKFDIASTKSLSNYSFHLGASNTNIEEIKKVDINQAAALKVFMGASTGEMLVDSLDALDDIFNYSPLIVVTHCEDQTTVKNNEKIFLEKYGDDLSAQHHHLIRDVESCYLSSSLAVSLAKKYDSDLHVFHLTTEKEMELFTKGEVDGKKITSEVCVHHMHFNEKDYAELGNQIKCNPSIKEESDRLALIDSLLDDKIDIIATDHAPHTEFEKRQQDFEAAPFGITGLETVLPSMFHYFINENKMDWGAMVKRYSSEPRKLLGHDSVDISEGEKAELVIFDVNGETVFTKDFMESKSPNTPFLDKTLKGCVELVVVGEEVLLDRL